jgi:hypothetical protein
MPYAAALVPVKRIHFCREASAQRFEESTFLCPRCTNKDGHYFVTSNQRLVTCKLCRKWMSEDAIPLPAGTYWVGDLCHVLTADDWAELPAPPMQGESWTATIQGQTLWMGWTAYGDGIYDDEEGHAYGVDSGSIGVMPVTACDPVRLAEAQHLELGRVVHYPAPFTPTCTGGSFRLGPISIDTRGNDN